MEDSCKLERFVVVGVRDDKGNVNDYQVYTIKRNTLEEAQLLKQQIERALIAENNRHEAIKKVRIELEEKKKRYKTIDAYLFNILNVLESLE